MTGLAGVSHVTLSTPDLPAARDFWIRTMGFEPVSDEPVVFLVHRAAAVGLLLTDHGGAVAGPFDERRTGLDHLAFAVPDEDALRAWEKRLGEHGVTASPIAETDAGLHLNLRAPDGVQVELYVMSTALATELGVTS